MDCKYVNIIENIKICSDVFKITIEFKGNEIKPGQFFMIYPRSNNMILGRPISVCEVNGNLVSFSYKIMGNGTLDISDIKSGEKIKVLGPLGNGFSSEEYKGKIALVAGGIGIAPFVELSKHLNSKNTELFCGFKDEVFLVDEIENNVSKVNISTEDGSFGYKGFITDILKPEEYELVICCGPEIMMKKVVEMCKQKNINIIVSLEKHMACGVGACLVCSCKTVSGMKRSCVDGPVFNGLEVVF